MAYAWQKESEKDGVMAARIPKGEHRARISRIVYGNDNGPFTSRSGDPQIMVIFQDREGREAPLHITLSERAGFVLARLMSCCDPPINLSRMEAEGVEPAHFANPEFADPQLLNRQLMIQVDYEKSDDGKDYARVVPIRPKSSGASDQMPQAAPPPPRPRPAVPPPPSEPPPAAEPAPNRVAPMVHNKDEAWAAVCRTYPGADDADKQQRNNAWLESIRAMNKPESQFTPDDWQYVVSGVVATLSGIPF